MSSVCTLCSGLQVYEWKPGIWIPCTKCEYAGMPDRPLTACQAGRDGDCVHRMCPQNNPETRLTNCPLPHWTDDPEY